MEYGILYYEALYPFNPSYLAGSLLLRCSLRVGWVPVLSFMLGLLTLSQQRGTLFYPALLQTYGVALQFPLIPVTSSGRKWGMLFVSESECKLSSPGPCWQQRREWGVGWERTPSDTSYHLIGADWGEKLSFSLNSLIEGATWSKTVDRSCFALSYSVSVMPAGERKISWPLSPTHTTWEGTQNVSFTHLFKWNLLNTYSVSQTLKKIHKISKDPGQGWIPSFVKLAVL